MSGSRATGRSGARSAPRCVRARRAAWHSARSQPAFPDRLEIGRQWRQRAEFDVAFAGRVEIGTARRLETEPAGDVRVFAILIGRVAAGDHFDRLAAKIDELGKKRV